MTHVYTDLPALETAILSGRPGDSAVYRVSMSVSPGVHWSSDLFIPGLLHPHGDKAWEAFEHRVSRLNPTYKAYGDEVHMFVTYPRGWKPGNPGKPRAGVLFIGVAGRAGQGKDPAGRVIAGMLDRASVCIPLAEGLKDMLAARYGVSPRSPLLYTARGKASPSPNPLKPGNTVRQDLIDLGDATRAIDPQIWVRETERRGVLSGEPVVISPDVRYANEVTLYDRVIWVGHDDPGRHPTESQLTSESPGIDWVFNLGSVEDNLEALRNDMKARLDWWVNPEPKELDRHSTGNIRLNSTPGDPE